MKPKPKEHELVQTPGSQKRDKTDEQKNKTANEEDLIKLLGQKISQKIIQGPSAWVQEKETKGRSIKIGNKLYEELAERLGTATKAKGDQIPKFTKAEDLAVANNETHRAL